MKLQKARAYWLIFPIKWSRLNFAIEMRCLLVFSNTHVRTTSLDYRRVTVFSVAYYTGPDTSHVALPRTMKIFIGKSLCRNPLRFHSSRHPATTLPVRSRSDNKSPLDSNIENPTVLLWNCWRDIHESLLDSEIILRNKRENLNQSCFRSFETPIYLESHS